MHCPACNLPASFSLQHQNSAETTSSVLTDRTFGTVAHNKHKARVLSKEGHHEDHRQDERLHQGGEAVFFLRIFSAAHRGGKMLQAHAQVICFNIQTSHHIEDVEIPVDSEASAVNACLNK